MVGSEVFGGEVGESMTRLRRAAKPGDSPTLRIGARESVRQPDFIQRSVPRSPRDWGWSRRRPLSGLRV